MKSLLIKDTTREERKEISEINAEYRASFVRG